MGHDENLHERPGATKEARLHRVHHPSSNAAKGAELLARLKALKAEEALRPSACRQPGGRDRGKGAEEPAPVAQFDRARVEPERVVHVRASRPTVEQGSGQAGGALGPEEDPHHAIRDAANRLSAVGLANYTPEPNETPVQFVLTWWRGIRGRSTACRTCG